MGKRDPVAVFEQLGLRGIAESASKPAKAKSTKAKPSARPREEYGVSMCDLCLGTGGHQLLGRCPACRGSGRTRYIRHLDANGDVIRVEYL